MNMATAQMFRVNQLAKDLGVKPKDIINMLEDSGLEGKKNTTALDAEEFNLFFDSITSASQIKNIDGYMSGETMIPAVKKSAAAKKAEEEAVAAAEKKRAEEEAAAAAAKKAEEEAIAAKKAAEEAAAAESAKKKVEEEAAAVAAKKAEEEAASAKKAAEKATAAKKAEEPTSANAAAKAEHPAERTNRPARTGDRPAVKNDRNDRADRSDNRADRSDRGDRSAQRPQNNGRTGDRPGQGDRFQNRDRANGQNGRDRDRRDGMQNRPGQGQGAQSPFKLSERDSRPGNPSGTIQKAKTQQAGPERKRTGGTRVVDTRTTSVDLSKYDERLENFVPDSSSDSSSNRQKLKKQNTRDFRSAKNRDKERLAMERLRKQELEKAKKQPLKVSIPDEITVGELASRLKVTAAKVMKSLMMMGVMATVNQTIDYDTAYLVADEMGAVVTREVVVTIEEKLFSEEEDVGGDLVERSPVVCVMGHVDHGKTSLLDAIRHTNVTSGEAGGITQHIGAYRVRVNDKDITFLDTPGHEAFTAMRARGAMATDIAILVVAADDGIMPQTVEAINHAKAAGVDIIVAINKMDKPAANPDAVKTALTNYSLVPEEWGGDIICVPVSAITRQGIDDLLESVLLVAEMKELKANPAKRAKGIVIEARLDKGRGPVATVLVQNGTLHSGDIVIAGTAVGRVRAMTNDRGEQLKAAGPSVPVEIIGLAEVPLAGDEFNSVEDERMARTLAEQRRSKAKEETFNANAKVNLDDLFAQIRDGVKELDIIVKADVGGSAEAVKASLEKISNEEVRVRVIHSAVGGITESDVMLAAASNAIIVGFNVRPDKSAIDSAERQNVDIRTYRIIYECIEEITAAMKGMLAPTYQEVLLGHCEVRQTIHVPNVGTVAGSYVQDGKITRNSQIRIVRDGIVVFEDKISSLRRFKDDVREVQQGYECGIGLEKYNDIKEGDILEAFIMEEVAR